MMLELHIIKLKNPNIWGIRGQEFGMGKTGQQLQRNTVELNNQINTTMKGIMGSNTNVNQNGPPF